LPNINLAWVISPPGRKYVQSMAPASIAEANGTQYFKHVVIT
jgi:hypothetical protein